ncbi:hypothetical protein ARUE_c19110 [Arthrobacter sp. Rue61a]|nr:hypothetical protein ARUE_c19110 [Arthrobacter sp. Rue61a]
MFDRAEQGVDNVHTLHLGLPSAAAGLARIPYVSATCLESPRLRHLSTKQIGFLG